MGKRILVVDDSSIMRKMVVKTLKAGGHVIAGEAKSGKEAIALYESLKPDVVTMDITMREMDGFTAAREILRIDAGAQIVFLSNLDKEKYSQQAKDLGARGYVNKRKAMEMLMVIGR
jgi:two-component system chemotaxis response regulator CheY